MMPQPFRFSCMKGILIINKQTIGLADASKGSEFTFNVILQNENGTLVDDDQYYWCAENVG